MRKLFISVLLFAGSAIAQDATPIPEITATPETTPTVAATPTATVSACTAVQLCVDQAVPTAIAQCMSANPDCTTKNTDMYGLSAGQLARRAIDNMKCPTRMNRGKCNSCYQVAKVPLKKRFKGDIFHGTLAQAVRLIEAERVVVCPSLPKAREGKHKS